MNQLAQTSLDFTAPKLSPQCQKLYDRLKMGSITNCQMRDELRLLSYTRRIFEVKKAIEPDKTINKKHLGNGIYEYSITNQN